MSNTVMMVAKKLLHACIRRKKLILFLSVCVLSFFNFYITDNVVSMQTYRNRRKELQASPNPSVKPLRSLEHAFTNDASPESTNKTILYKMIKSTRKQLNRTETILDPGIKQPPDLTTSIDHQLKPDVHFNFAADEYSANLLGKTNDSSLIPDEKKLTTVKAEPKPCLGCEERQTTNYHGTDYMALVSIFITALTCLYAMHCDFYY